MYNKKIETSEIIGGQGVMIMTSDNSSTLWHNGENIDLVKRTTTVQTDTSFLTSQMMMHMQMFAPQMIETQLERLIKEKVRFDMVSWLNDDGLPEVTCQLFYGDKLVGEKTTLTTAKGTENVATPT